MADKKVNTGYGILSYIGILILIPFLDEKFKKTEYGKFHLNQALVLIIGWFIVSFAWVVPILGWIVGFVGGILLFVLWIMAIIGAAQGNMNKVPLLGDIKIIK